MMDDRLILVILGDVGHFFRISRRASGEFVAELLDTIHDGLTYSTGVHETDFARFVRETGVWLEERLSRYAIMERVAVLAPGRFLKAMERLWPSQLVMRVSVRSCDIQDASPASIVQNPVVLAFMRE